MKTLTLKQSSTVREHPVLFSSPMVLALLANQKTQTRRVVTARNSTANGYRFGAKSHAWAGLDFSRAVVRNRSTLMMALVGDRAPLDVHFVVPWKHPEDLAREGVGDPEEWVSYRVRPRWEVGDRLWVRETWGLMDTQPEDGPERATIGYRADGDENAPNGRHQLWRPSIFMPRWACRIMLEIVEIRAQRAQEIDALDALAEGIEGERIVSGSVKEAGREPRFHEGWEGTSVDGFRNLWDEINGKRGYGWEVNPPVWATTFKRMDTPEAANIKPTKGQAK